MTRFSSKWLMVAVVALLTACSAETTVLGPAQPPAIERLPSVVDENEFKDAATEAPQNTQGRFTRYAMAAS